LDLLADMISLLAQSWDVGIRSRGIASHRVHAVTSLSGGAVTALIS
jgi:hypothetical protein